jgi:hypothetical protein
MHRHEMGVSNTGADPSGRYEDIITIEIKGAVP